jgi:hypothetical protein
MPVALALGGFALAGAGVALGHLVGGAWVIAGWAAVGRSLELGGVHGAFVALGVAVALVRGPAQAGDRPGEAGDGPALALCLMAMGAFTGAALLAHLVPPWGSLAYVCPPILLACGARLHPALRRMGVAGSVRPRALVVGVLAGAFLGAHLLITASLTFGHRARVNGAAQYMEAVLYDIGVNAVTAEWLFRGALFWCAWQRVRFWAAASLSTAAALVRYLLDPALPAAPEVAAGAIFYLALLGLACCALRAWSGSLIPGYLSTVAFFAAYRALAE